MQLPLPDEGRRPGKEPVRARPPEGGRQEEACLPGLARDAPVFGLEPPSDCEAVAGAFTKSAAMAAEAAAEAADVDAATMPGMRCDMPRPAISGVCSCDRALATADSGVKRPRLFRKSSR